MPKRMLWKFHETQAMLQIIIQHKSVLLDNSTVRQNRAIYEDVSRQMAKQKMYKTVDQIRSKFKFLKCLYYKTLKNEGRAALQNTFGEHFELMEKLLGTEPRSLYKRTHRTEYKPEEIQDDDLEDGIIQFIEAKSEEQAAESSAHEEKYIHESSAEDAEEVAEWFKKEPSTFQIFENEMVQPFETVDSSEAGIEDGISMHMKALAKDINDTNLPHLELMKLKRQISNVVYDFILHYKNN